MASIKTLNFRDYEKGLIFTHILSQTRKGTRCARQIPNEIIDAGVITDRKETRVKTAARFICDTFHYHNLA